MLLGDQWPRSLVSVLLRAETIVVNPDLLSSTPYWKGKLTTSGGNEIDEQPRIIIFECHLLSMPWALHWHRHREVEGAPSMTVLAVSYLIIAHLPNSEPLRSRIDLEHLLWYISKNCRSICYIGSREAIHLQRRYDSMLNSSSLIWIKVYKEKQSQMFS